MLTSIQVEKMSIRIKKFTMATVPAGLSVISMETDVVLIIRNVGEKF